MAETNPPYQDPGGRAPSALPDAVCDAVSRKEPREALCALLEVLRAAGGHSGVALWHTEADRLDGRPRLLARVGEVPADLDPADPASGTRGWPLRVGPRELGRVVTVGGTVGPDDTPGDHLIPLLAPLVFTLVQTEESDSLERATGEMGRLSAALVGRRGLQDTAGSLVEEVATLFGADQAVLFLGEPDCGWLSPLAVLDHGGVSVRSGSALRPREGSRLQEIGQGTPVLVDLGDLHAGDHEALAPLIPLPDAGRCLGVPLHLGGEPTGMLLLVGALDEAFTGSLRRHHVAALGSRLGWILESRRVLEERERELRNFRHLLDTSRTVASVLDLAEVPELVARSALELCEADQSVLFLLGEDGQTLRPAVCLGPDAEEFLQLEAHLGLGITGNVALSRRPEIVNAPGQDPRAAKVPGTDDDDQETMLLAPLVCADRLLGVLVLYKLGTGPFRPVDLGIIDVFSTSAAIAIANANLFATVHEERIRLGTMVEHMQEGVVFGDPAGNVLLANGAALRLVGAETPADGNPVGALLAHGDFAPVRAARDRVRAGETAHLTGEFRRGSRSHLFSVSAVHGEGERPGGEVLLFRDISDLRSIEAQLVESNKMSAVGQLAAGVAHEFNNLIASVFGYAQLLRVNREPAMLDKGLDVILQSSRRAQELTNGLLTFSRRPDGTREPVDLADLLERTLILLRRQLDKSEIRVETDLADLPRITGDAAGLQQVFLNLLINAQQAVGQAGVIRITGHRRDGAVDLVVEDTGAGIPAEHLDRVFEPFFTTKGALGASRTPGVGLGLTTAYNVVQGHGGTLRAENRPEGGARFVISLPAKTASPAPDALRPAAGGTGSWILLMEGEGETRQAIEGVLRASGHHPRAVEGAEKALEALGSTAPDLAILDRLPGLGLKSPYALLRDRMPELPILFVVDRQQAEEFTGLSDPWVFLLRKPFRSRDLASLVDRVLGRRLDAAS